MRAAGDGFPRRLVQLVVVGPPLARRGRRRDSRAPFLSLWLRLTSLAPLPDFLSFLHFLPLFFLSPVSLTDGSSDRISRSHRHRHGRSVALCSCARLPQCTVVVLRRIDDRPSAADCRAEPKCRSRRRRGRTAVFSLHSSVCTHGMAVAW